MHDARPLDRQVQIRLNVEHRHILNHVPHHKFNYEVVQQQHVEKGEAVGLIQSLCDECVQPKTKTQGIPNHHQRHKAEENRCSNLFGKSRRAGKLFPAVGEEGCHHEIQGTNVSGTHKKRRLSNDNLLAYFLKFLLRLPQFTMMSAIHEIHNQSNYHPQRSSRKRMIIQRDNHGCTDNCT